MDLINLKLERSKSSIRKLGRSRSTLLASELIPCGISRDTTYERLSKSMRNVEIVDEDTSIISHKRKKNKAWVFLMRVFSFKKTIGDENISEKVVDAGEKSMEVVAGINKEKMQSSSWERAGETITQKPGDQVLVVEKKKIRQPTFLPDPYRRWPVQGWRY
ncbi:uncharacterized protein LOC132036780 [Lycium ferocissimum]|uniref:uncharacterized protein LOC132036780 n=1 Tax=Lycium ferocissimum TaxID=112874 RepID=UPI0028167C85|nr:uncharacterized protein LOC132036780 [Lycium ferocissimum]